MPVRRALRADVPAMLAISNAVALRGVANFAIEPEPLGDWLREFDSHADRYPWLVTTDDAGAVCGFARAGRWKGRCAYAYAVEPSVYIDPDRRGEGRGRALYARLLALLDAQGYTTAIAGITLPNPASVTLHESFGFVHAGTFHRVGWKHGAWHDVGYWQRLRSVGGAPDPVRAVEAAEAMLAGIGDEVR